MITFTEEKRYTKIYNGITKENMNDRFHISVKVRH